MEEALASLFINKNLRIPNVRYLFVRHSFSGTLFVRKGVRVYLMICKEIETNYKQKCDSCIETLLLPHDLNTNK